MSFYGSLVQRFLMSFVLNLSVFLPGMDPRIRKKDPLQSLLCRACYCPFNLHLQMCPWRYMTYPILGGGKTPPKQNKTDVSAVYRARLYNQVQYNVPQPCSWST